MQRDIFGSESSNPKSGIATLVVIADDADRARMIDKAIGDESPGSRLSLACDHDA